MSDFGNYLRRATYILATGIGDIKSRIYKAVQELSLARCSADGNTPQYFKDNVNSIITALNRKEWGPYFGGDRVRATLYRMHGKTVSKYAIQIWELYNHFLDYERYGITPETEPRSITSGIHSGNKKCRCKHPDTATEHTEAIRE